MAMTDQDIDRLYKTPKRAWWNFGFLFVIMLLIFFVFMKGKKKETTISE